jgi:hypothetical protein
MNNPPESLPVSLKTPKDLEAAIAEAARLELRIITATTKAKKMVEEIKAMTANECAKAIAQRDELETQAINYVKQNRSVLLPKGKASVSILGHKIKVTTTSAAACDDEAAALARLEQEAKHGADLDQREASEACLRRSVELDKTFIHKHWELHSKWFESLGMRIETGEKWDVKFNFSPEATAAK